MILLWGEPGQEIFQLVAILILLFLLIGAAKQMQN